MSINRNLSKFAPKINSSGQAAVAEITVTVASVGGGNRYHFDGTSQQTVSLSKSITYRFNTSDSSVSGHPLRFSETSNGTHGGGSQYTTGITTVGTAGSAGSYVEVTLEADAPDILYTYCQHHSNMGGLVKTAPVGDANFASFASTFTFPTSDGSANQVLQTDGSGALSFGTPASSYADSDVDTHLNRSSATGGDYLFYNGNDYSWQSALNELSDDTTPQLGGDLDVVTRSIVSTSNRNINITPNGSGKVVLDGISHPNADGNSGQVLTTDGSGNLSFASVGSLAGSGIQNVSDDTSPQLGASLDVVTHSIVSTSNRDINITPDGSGKVVLDGLSYPQADGSADQVLKTDGSGNLSFVDQATGGGGGTFTATASGALSDGTLVAVNADGTVSNVLFATPASVGSETILHSGSLITYPSAIVDPDTNKVIVVYSHSNTSKCAVGTISGTSISFGTPVNFESGNNTSNSIAYDTTNNKVVIGFNDLGDTDHGKAIVGTVSGTSISFGSPVKFYAGLTGEINVVYDSNAQKMVFIYRDSQNNGVAKAIVGTVSGTSISFGSPANIGTTSMSYASLVYDSNANKVVAVYRDSANSSYGTAAVGTVSGTSISFGTPAVFNSAVTQRIGASFDSTENKVVIGYHDDGNNSYGTAIVGNVSGTSISFGSAVVFNSANTINISPVYDSNTKKTHIAYLDYGDGEKGKLIAGTVSGTSISFETAIAFNNPYHRTNAAAFDPNTNKVVVFYGEYTNQSNGAAVVVTPSSTSQILTSENFVGISDGAYANGATATIQTAGSIDDAQSGLTAGQSYYVQLDGTLGLSPDTVEVLAGTAVSATELLINPDTNPATFGTSQVDAHLNLSGASSGQVLSYNGSDYAWTDDVAGAGSITATASGALANGEIVILNSDGTVSVPSANVAASTGSAVDFISGAGGMEYAVGVYDPDNQKVIFVYMTGSTGYGTATVGTVSGNSITFGSPAYFTTGSGWFAFNIDAAYDPTNDKVVITFQDRNNSNYGAAIVGTVSGTSISFGTKATFESSAVYKTKVEYDPNTGKFLVVYILQSGGLLRAKVFSVSGTSITVGFEATVTTTSMVDNYDYDMVYDASAQRIVIAYAEGTSSGRARVATIVDTSVGLGSAVTFFSGNIGFPSITYDSTAQKVLVGYEDQTNSQFSAVVGTTVTGNPASISFGSVASISDNADNISSRYDPDANVHTFVFRNESDSNVLSTLNATISGTSVSIGSASVLLSGVQGTQCNLVYDTANKKMVSIFRNVSSSNIGTCVVFNNAISGNPLTDENYIGISNAAYADGATATIQTAGSVDDAQSGLTPAQTYFVQTNGTIALTPSSPSVVAGTAISATQLLIKSGQPIEKPNTTQLVASGTLADGTKVCVNSDGTASAITETVVSGSVGTSVTHNSAYSDDHGVAYDTVNQKVLIVYKDVGNSSYGTAQVGTVSGTSISFGSKSVFEESSTDLCFVIWDENADKFAIIYRASYAGRCKVATISGTSVSFGSRTDMDTSSMNMGAGTFDSTNNKIIVAYGDGTSNSQPTVRIGTISGTTCSFGSKYAIDTGGYAQQIGIAHDANSGKTVFAYKDAGNSNYGAARVGTVAGSSITFGTKVTFSGSNAISDPFCVYDPVNYKVVVLYNDEGNSNKGTALVGTVSGTDISFGSAAIFEANAMKYTKGVYHTAGGKVVAMYRLDGGNNNDNISSAVGTISGTSISFETPVSVTSFDTQKLGVAYDAASQNLVVSTRDSDNSNYGKTTVVKISYSSQNLTSTNYIGISDAAYTNGQTATIQVAGATDDAQSGLTAGQLYYVQNDGTLSTTADSPSVIAGTAISATKLIVKG